MTLAGHGGFARGCEALGEAIGTSLANQMWAWAALPVVGEATMALPKALAALHLRLGLRRPHLDLMRAFAASLVVARQSSPSLVEALVAGEGLTRGLVAGDTKKIINK